MVASVDHGNLKPDSQYSTASPDEQHRPHKFSWTWFAYKSVLTVLTAPYRRAFKLYTWKPLKDFRKAYGDRRALIPLVRDWKVDKYAELQSVQVAASFCAGATLATLSWTSIPNAFWLCDAFWFCSLICSIWAVITSIQSRSILDDIPDREQLTQRLSDCEFKRMRRVILRYKRTPGLAHWTMLFVWQFPSMTMSYAWCTFLAGLTVYVCSPLIRRTHPWSDHHRVAVAYLTVFTLGFLTYLFSSIFVYATEKGYLQSAANTRQNTDTTDPMYEAGYGNGYPSSLVVSDHGPTAPPTPATEIKLPGGGQLECIPEHDNIQAHNIQVHPIGANNTGVARAQTLPLPDMMGSRPSSLRDTAATARPRSAFHLRKPRFLI